MCRARPSNLEEARIRFYHDFPTPQQLGGVIIGRFRDKDVDIIRERRKYKERVNYILRKMEKDYDRLQLEEDHGRSQAETAYKPGLRNAIQRTISTLRTPAITKADFATQHERRAKIQGIAVKDVQLTLKETLMLKMSRMAQQMAIEDFGEPDAVDSVYIERTGEESDLGDLDY